LLSKKLEQDIGHLDSPVKRRYAKFHNAVQKSRADRALLRADNKNLFEQNNEKKIRASTRSTVIGRAKIMTYDDILAARNKRAAEESGIADQAKNPGDVKKRVPSFRSLLIAFQMLAHKPGNSEKARTRLIPRDWKVIVPFCDSDCPLEPSLSDQPPSYLSCNRGQ
jgi:hypothetical protein